MIRRTWLQCKGHQRKDKMKLIMSWKY